MIDKDSTIDGAGGHHRPDEVDPLGAADAASIAKVILTTEAILTESPEAGAGMGGGEMAGMM